MTEKPKTVQEYIATKPKDAQKRLFELREYLKAAYPEASEELKWGKPALVHNGILYVYAAAKKHISLHPTPSVISYFRNEFGSLISSDNTIQFSLNDPIPEKVVMKIAKQRIFEKENKGIKWK
ncbi:MAG: DUF1801 domain-containing protein [Porticoccaceae bacterium]|nr:DUF1801 domain-containing protein [Pseudomonadales bacterium]MCP5171791.1 DUF1801 domain-containing protein [Pseudomonadales bacterium]